MGEGATLDGAYCHFKKPSLMKTTTFLFLILFSLPVIAQRGYCPCMEREKKNDGLDLSEVLDKITSEAVRLNTVAVEPKVTQAILVSHRPNLPPPPPPVREPSVQETATVQQIQQQLAPPPVPEKVEQRASVRSESRGARLSKARKIKRKRVKLRSKKRVKKYRGKCPKFGF